MRNGCIFMKIYTDDPPFAESLLDPAPVWRAASLAEVDPPLHSLASQLFPPPAALRSAVQPGRFWKYLLIVKHTPLSQFDLLIESVRVNPRLPGGILCIADTGEKLHGFRNRPWQSLSGNLHLSVFLTPGREIPHFQVGFIVLAAVSVLETLNSLPGLKEQASIKWVNDILLGGAKVSGVLAHTLTQGKTVTAAALGIGINVEATPALPPDPFVLQAASLRDFAAPTSPCSRKWVFARLIRMLEKNYRRLLAGEYQHLLEVYRRHSAVIGREAAIYSDPPDAAPQEIRRGKIRAIGENLELFLENSDLPVTRGRLAFLPREA